jgi:cold-inducible RNA-binding protein
MGTRLFVGNLSYNVNEQELKEAFVSEGIEVRSVKVALDRESGRPRGFAFVETMTDEGAKASIEKLSGRMLQGRTIVVEEAQARAAGPRPAGGGPPRPGGFGAGPPRPGGFGGPPRPGGFGGPPRPGGPPPVGAAPPRGGERDARGGERRERPEKKRSSRPKPEERERGNWRWNRGSDYDD